MANMQYGRAPRKRAALSALFVVPALGLVLAVAGYFFGLRILWTLGVVVFVFGLLVAIIVGIIIASGSGSARSQNQASAGVVPGWYPDPQNPTLVRYFDGRVWTSSTHPRSS
jgi:uncharacterized membrane protein YraQ (UPF0718 family)